MKRKRLTTIDDYRIDRDKWRRRAKKQQAIIDKLERHINGYRNNIDGLENALKFFRDPQTASNAHAYIQHESQIKLLQEHRSKFKTLTVLDHFSEHELLPFGVVTVSDSKNRLERGVVETYQKKHSIRTIKSITESKGNTLKYIYKQYSDGQIAQLIWRATHNETS